MTKRGQLRLILLFVVGLKNVVRLSCSIAVGDVLLRPV